MTTMMMYLLLVMPSSQAVKLCGTFSMARTQPSGVAAEMISRLAGELTVVIAALLRGGLDDLLVLLGQALPEVGVDDEERGGVEMAGRGQILLHIVEAIGGDDGQGVLLAVDRALLQRGIELAEVDDGGGGAEGLEHHFLIESASIGCAADPAGRHGDLRGLPFTIGILVCSLYQFDRNVSF